nr:MAG TPA: hypothetical protein [Caudoviricetes sp.]
MGPVGHGPDDRGARRGRPPFGWSRQGRLVAGRYPSGPGLAFATQQFPWARFAYVVTCGIIYANGKSA